MTEPRWTRGDAALQREIERQLASGEAQSLHDNVRRAVYRVRSADFDVIVKQFRVGSGRHALRERTKARLGRAPADREWKMLARMHGAGIAVPEPLALGTRPDGDRLLALRWVDGAPLTDALRDTPAARRALLDALATLVRRVHELGFVHGDLHAGNVLVTARGPVLLDWQHARATRAPQDQRADLARLEFSLAPLVSRGRRLRVRRTVLGLSASRDHGVRDALRSAGDAAAARAREHARSRTASVCREGRRAAAFDAEGARGLRLRELPAEALLAIRAAHRAAVATRAASVAKSDARSSVSMLEVAGHRVVVKETPFRGVARALADVARGSAGFRAWRAGHGLLARRIGAALPYAFGERRVLGVPIASWVVLEDLRPATPASFALDESAFSAEETIDALAHFVIALHRARVDHGDLKGTHLLLRRAANTIEVRAIDLEGVRFPRRLREARRLRALSELNASLPDAMPALLRCRAFRRYAAALPLRDGWQSALQRVVRESLAREHRWTGAGCDAAERR